MAETGLVSDSVFQQHETHSSHPERPQRVQHIRKVLAQRELDTACVAIEPVPVATELMHANHDATYIERVQKACANGAPYIDVPDSSICPASFEIARLAAGGVVEAVRRVADGSLENAFCAVRPPGHHCERHMSMGFCLLNHIAIAARFLMSEYDLTRVLILDWDVHHGNGTQHTFEEDPRVLFISIHGDPRFLFPGTGYAHERGRGDGEGFTVNIPLLPGAGDAEYRKAFDETIRPAIDNFRPEFVLVSAGYDAHRSDPLAPLNLETESFGWMTDVVLEAAATHCNGKLVCVLEGGYNLIVLADSVALTIARLLGKR